MKRKIMPFFMVIIMCFVLVTSTSAYYIHYQLGSAYRVIGIVNDLSSCYSSIFDDAISIWNNGISDRSFMESSGAANSIIDLDYTEAVEIDSQLGFLFYNRYVEYGTYKAWSYNSNTCCSDHQTTSFIIYLNTYMLPETEDEEKTLWVITHELGHALGLDDFENLALYRDHVMNYAYSYSIYSSPSNSEFYAADTIWDH